MRRTLIVCLLIPFVLNSFGVDFVPPTSLTITGYEGPIEEGSTLQLQAIPTPSNTTYTEYIWSSDEMSVATIDDNGLVTAISEGTATIKCLLTIAGPRYFAIPDEQTATCTIVVKKKTPIVETITFANPEVKRICVENWDTDGDGELSYDEAAAVTDLQRRFSSNKAITQFNELQYFKGLTILYNEFSHCEALQSVVIPENVVTVGAYAFSWCKNLTHVELPEGLDMLGDFAFIGCEKLPQITIPKSVKTIYNWTFQNCNNLTSIEIPENVNHMGNNIISACEKLTTINVNANNNYYDSRDNCNAIIQTNANTLIAACQTTKIPNSIKALGTYAFNFCKGLTSIEIPNSVESIGYGAFNGDSITSIRIPANVSYIGLRVFGYCDKLSSIEVDDNNPIYDSRNNCNAIIETATNTLIAGSINTIIPDDVTSIADYAFFGYYSLKNIVLPRNIASIGTDSFWGINFSTVTAKMETPAVIASEGTLYGRKQATLYVPKGCKAVYEAAEYWKDFKEIVEIEDENPNVEVTDIAQMDNAIYIEPFTAFIGNDVNVEICLKNSQTATAYVFNMILPEGVTVATNSNGEYIDELSCRHDDHMRMFNYLDENTYTLLSLSTNSEKLKDNESAIRLLTLHVSDELAEGVYAIEIKNASYSKPDGTLVRLQDTTSSITLGDFVCGDVNSDGKVDVSDYIGVANHIMGNTPEGFVMKAADVDESGTIDVSDYIGIANLIMTGNVFGNNNQSRISRKGEIE